MYRRILVPLDGSATAEQALAHAKEQAKRFRAELELVHITEPSSSFSGVEFVQDKRREQALEYLNRVAGRIRKHGLPVNVAIYEGRAHEEICRYAEDESVDLIVLSSRGQSGLTRWMMGSVADRVIRGSQVPVLIVRALGARLGPSNPEYRRIMLPLDGTKLAEQAIPHALAQAERFQAELILIQAHELILSARAVAVVAESRLRDEAELYLNRIAERAKRRGVRASSVIITGVPHRDLVRYAESNQVDLIVLNAHGHSGPGRWLIGGFAERVTRGATIPVLLTRDSRERKSDR